MKTRLLSVFLSILLLTSIFFPAANAAPNDKEEPPLGAVFAAAPAIPAISEFVYAGVVVLIAGAGVVEIGKHLDIRWEDPAESWEEFAERVSTALEKVFAKQIIDEGIDKILEDAGFELRLPSCSACLAMNPDKVPAGKLSLSTSNRNFVGRQGPGARTVLASPLTVAASAITGVITDPR